MALPAIAKIAEMVSKVSEGSIGKSFPVETVNHGEFGQLKTREAGTLNEVKEIPKEGRPDLDVIRTETLQQIIEENKLKIQEVRDAIKADDSNEKTDDSNENTEPLENNEADEDRELTEDEINEKQRAAIKEALENLRMKNWEILAK